MVWWKLMTGLGVISNDTVWQQKCWRVALRGWSAVLAASEPPGNNMWQGPTVKLYVLRHRYAVIVCAACSKAQIVWSVLVAEQYFHNAKTIRVISGPAAVQSLVYPEGDHLGIAGTQLSCKITFHILAQILSWFKAELLCGRVFHKQ